MQTEKGRPVFSPLPIRSNEYQLLGFGFSGEDVHFSHNRIDGDDLMEMKMYLDVATAIQAIKLAQR